MIDYDLDTAHSTLQVRPKSALDKKDFVELAKAVDPQIEATGDLAGLIINARRTLMMHQPPDYRLLAADFVYAGLLLWLGVTLLGKLGAKASEKL